MKLTDKLIYALCGILVAILVISVVLSLCIAFSI